MSKVIDERVVSMQFDNKHFESNVKTTMSTLDKLKQSLNLSGASKSLESVSAAASKCNLSPLSNAAETVRLKFSAMEVMAITALTNITNSAVNAGKRMVESLTIEPITLGFNEYELKMGAIQTIMASTGESLATVNEYLNELNTYSDKTIYSFQDMTQNIGKFTNAGVKLEDAVIAIKGIANEAAVSGANANEASRAMYNFSQALSTGYVQRIDWKSIELANMATVEFKEQLLSMAAGMGTVEKNADGMWKAVGDDSWYNTSQMFIEALDEQWLTSEVLIETLKEYADETTNIGKKAMAAATEVKTFTMMMDTLKESAQSGWAATWETIVGDYNESKNLFTSLSEVIGGWIDGMSDTRNNFLAEVLDSNWEKTIRQLNKAGISTEQFEEAIKGVIANSTDATKTLNDQGKTLTELIDEYGSLREVFESGLFSSDILTDAIDKVIGGFENLELTIDRVLNRGTIGDDVSQMQKVLKELGYDLGAFGANLDGIDGSFGPVTQAAVKAFQEARGLTVDGIVGPETLAALEDAARELNNVDQASESVVKNLKDLVKNVDNLGGRKKLIESFSKLWGEFSKILDAVNEGWNNVFGKVDFTGIVIDIIDKFSQWVNDIKITEQTLGNVKSIIEGIASAIQTGAILGKGVFGAMYTIFTKVTRLVGVDLLSVLGNLGDALVGFRKILVDDNVLNEFFTGVATKLAAGIDLAAAKLKELSDNIKQWFIGFKNFEGVKEILDSIASSFGVINSKLVTWFGGFGEIFSDFFDILSAMDSITLDGLLHAFEQLWRDIINHFSDLDVVFGSLLGPVTKLLEKFLEYSHTEGIFRSLVGWVQKAYDAYQNWINGVAGFEDLPKKVGQAIANGIIKILESVGRVLGLAIKAIVSAITGIPMEISDEMSDSGLSIGLNIIMGLVKGLANGIRFVIDATLEAAKTLIKTFCDKLGIHSPSTVFMAFGGFIVAGLVAGILSNLSEIGSVLSKVGSYISENFESIITSISEMFGNLDFSKLSAGFWLASAAIPGANILNIFAAITNVLSSAGASIGTGISNVATGTKNGLSKFGNILSTAFKFIYDKVTGFVTFFKENFGSIVAIIGGFMLTRVVTKLAEVVLSLTTVVSKISGAISGMFKAFGNAAEFVGKGIFIFFLARSISELAGAFVKLADLSWNDIGKGAAVIGGLAIVLSGLTVVLSLFAKKMGAFDSSAMFSMAVVMISFAASLTILVYALTLMDQVDDSRILKHVAAIGALAIGLGVVAAIMSKVKGEVTKGSLAMIAISAAILILVFALTKLNALSIDRPGEVISVLVGFAAGLALVALMSKGINTGAVFGMLGMIASIWLFAKLLAKLATYKEALNGGLGTVLLILGMFAGMMAATRLISAGAGGDMFKVCSGILMLSLALTIIVAAMKSLAKMDSSGVDQALKVVASVMLLFALMMAASKFSGEHAMRAGVMLIMMSTAMLVLTGAIWLLSLIGKNNADGLREAMNVVTIIMMVFAGLIAVTKLAQNSMGAIIALTAAVTILVAAIGVMSILAKDPASLWNAVAALSTIMLVFAALIATLQFVQSGKAALGSIGVLLALAGCMFLMGDLIKKIAAIENPDKAFAVIGGISVLLLAMIGAAKLLSTVNGVSVNAAIAAIGIVALVWVLGEIISNLSDLDPQRVIGTVAALSTLIVALGASVRLLNGFDKTGIKTLGQTIAVIGLMVLGFAFILYHLRDLDPAQAIGTATALSELILALGVSVRILNGFKKTGAKTLSQTLVAMGAMVLALGAILALFNNLDPVNAIATAGAISVLLLALAGATAILSMVGPGAALGITAAGSLLKLIGIVGLIALAVGALMQAIGLETLDKWKAGLESFMDFLVILTTGLGEAIGGFVGGLVGGTLVGLGKTLSDFMINVQGFVEGARNIDVSVLTGVATLVGAIMALTAASVIERITSWLGLGSVDSLGKNLTSFGTVMKSFCDSIRDLTPADIVKIQLASTAGQALATLANKMPKTGGLWQSIAGEADMASFGLRMEAYGKSLIRYARTVSGLTDADATAIENSATAGEAMATLEGKVPKSNGWWQDVAGSSDIADFGLRMEAFGNSLIRYARTVSGLTEEDANAITNSATVGEAMSAMETSIPKSDGWWQAIAGESDMETFGLRMVAFGHSLCDYANAVAELPANSAEVIAKSKTAAEALVAVANVIPKDNGWWGAIAGDQNFEAFGKGMYEIGRGLEKYCDVAASIGKYDTENIKESKTAIEAMVDVAKALPNEGGLGGLFAGDENIAAFGVGMAELARGVKDYLVIAREIDWATAIDPIENSKTVIKAMSEAAKTLPTVAIDFSSFNSGMTSLGHMIVNFKEAIAGIDVVNDKVRINGVLDMVKTMVASAEDIVELSVAGGLFGYDTNDMNMFGSAMCSLVYSVSDFITASEGIDENSTAKIGYSTAAIKALAATAGFISEQGFEIGSINFSTFGTTMCSIATDLVSYATIAEGITQEKLDSVINTKTMILKWIDAAKAAVGFGEIDLTQAKTATNAFADVLNAVRELASININGAGSITDILTELGNASVDGFVSAFTGASGKVREAGAAMMISLVNGIEAASDKATDIQSSIIKGMLETIRESLATFKEGGVQMMQSMITGISIKGTAMVNLVGKFVTGAATTIRSGYSTWYTAGGYLGSGLVAGIGAKAEAAYNAGYALGQAAVKGEKDGQQSNSPSKATIQAGHWIGEGLIIGMKDMAKSVYESGSDLGHAATGNISSVISTLSDAISADIDSQPTIRPVMDLSDVKSGISSIGNMIDMGATVGVTANVGMLSSMMNSRNQNGTNDDVVSAINRLGRELGNVGGTSYNINGITYDSGSSTSDAVRALVRAIGMERRV